MNQTDFDALGAAAGPASHALFVLERNLTIRSVNEVGKAFGLAYPLHEDPSSTRNAA